MSRAGVQGWFMADPSRRGCRFGAPVLLGGAAICIAVWPGAAEALEYSRAAVIAGEWWRAVTGHWSHASADHLGWDLLVFVGLGCALAARSTRAFWTAVVGSSLGIPLALLALGPSWHSYRGLSGIDTALFVALAVTVWLDRRQPTDRWLAGTALLLLVLKLATEAATGSPLFASPVAGYEVVPLAHGAGAVAGLAAAGLQRIKRRT